MRKKKRLRTAIIIVLVLGLLGTGGYFGGRYYLQSRQQSVEVMPVSVLNAAEWIQYYNQTSSYGTVVSDVSQQVFVPGDKVVSEVYVQQGDEVKVGDKLLSYDTTLLELDKELQDLTCQEIDLEIESAQADLKKLQNTTPVAKSQKDTEDFLGPNLALPGIDSDLTASEMVPSGRSAVTSQDDAGQPQTEAESTAADLDSAQASETQPAEVQASETQAAADQTDTPQAGGSDLQEPAAAADPDEEAEQLITENTAPGVLPEFPADSSSAEDSGQPKMNQSLLHLLSHICVKERTAIDEEKLLADTRQQEEEDIPVSAQLTGQALKLVLYFEEGAEAHFEKLNTYAMAIRGVTLQKEKAGIVYGASVEENPDAPEIGGFTLIQDPDRSDVAYLTLAFHSGLEEQHLLMPEILDVCLEIELNVDEITDGSLIFRTEKEENDVALSVQKPQPGAAEAETGAADGTQDTEPAQTEGAGSQETQTEGAGGTEPQPGDGTGAETQPGDGTQEEPGDGFQTEPETESESETESGIPTANVVFDITWYHGTNAAERWPESVQIRFYDRADADQENVLWSTTVAGSTDVPDDETEDPSGEEEPATESWTDIPADVDFPENEEEWQQWKLENQEGQETEGLPEEPGSVSQDSQTEGNSFSRVRWTSDVTGWPGELQDPKDYTVVVRPKDSINYIPRVEWSGTDETGTRTCWITMTYLEPKESPLVKLEPLSELDYWTGETGQYYKGSGTAEDPFIFFCTDGATIQSSFVNWVLGFNADGTERIREADGTERGGYSVILEIREADTITGAFIRSVGLDGTLRMEYGYAPGAYWIFSSDTGMVRYDEDIEDPFGDDGFDDPGWSDMGETYTAEELAQAVKEKEREIRRLNLNKKEAEMKLRQYERDVEESTVVSAVDGFVESMDGNVGGSKAYMVVTNEGGLYLQTTVGELDLGTVEKGDQLMATSWQTSMEFTAEVTQVDYYPTDAQDMYGNGNTNSSSYPVLARIEDASGLSPYEMVEVKFAKKETSGSSIYISVPYIRSENGQSYVYKRGADGLLKKQYVRTGATINEQVEIKEGLTNDDFIAFPYGKNVKDGAKTEESQNIYY